MAKPLFIAEILRVIISELAEDKQSLARLAQTSKAFTDPCLDGLWHTMDSFFPFIFLLPRNRLMTLSRPRIRIQRPGEWEYFDKYARRVRVYRQTDIDAYQKAYQVVSMMREQHLFPNLRDLDWRIIGSYSMETWSLSLHKCHMDSNGTIPKPNLTKVGIKISTTSPCSRRCSSEFDRHSCASCSSIVFLHTVDHSLNLRQV
ncbi:hypothetical protein P692DRAFT_20430590 [Suillus brevipes Sb2]|nr:hypothetical protein P692DRAFT_20430590 [Suillus brevipes Sb2]